MSPNIAYREQVAPFERAHGAMTLRDVSVELAFEWMREHRWTLGGIRAMFSDARRVGLVDTNPFAGLRLRGSRGRKDIEIPAREEVERLAEYAVEVWSDEVALTIRALILMAAFVGKRPAELYGLRWSDIDIRNDGDAMVFRGKKGGVLTGRTQHYYWHPVRCRFGKPSMDFYDLRHFCASWLFNELELPAQDVAHQLGHEDGGGLVQRLYGHPSGRLARERIKQATTGKPAAVVSLIDADQRQP